MVKNAYIHIPFCKSKCKYCSFISYPTLELKGQYLSALQKEIKYFYENEPLETLYIGGGTPSILEINEVKNIIDNFTFSKNAEITMELNPETLNYEYLSGLKNAGINRISIGCQTFDNEILKFIGRRHNSEQVKVSVKLAQEAGFGNISLDFIYGLPNQDIESFGTDLKTAVTLGVTHISLYGLKIDEGCYFYSHYPENLPDGDIQADMYLKAIEILTSSGFEHYEISNFAKAGYESRHNLNYWDNNSYYGFGIAAHGYKDSIRYSNYEDFDTYFKFPHIHNLTHRVDKTEQIEEEIFLGFRKTEGINVEDINRKFGIDFEKKYSNVLQKYLDTKHILKTKKGYKLSDKGILVSNYILADFI